MFYIYKHPETMTNLRTPVEPPYSIHPQILLGTTLRILSSADVQQKEKPLPTESQTSHLTHTHTHAPTHTHTHTHFRGIHNFLYMPNKPHPFLTSFLEVLAI